MPRAIRIVKRRLVTGSRVAGYFFLCTTAFPQTITTVAGNGIATFSGDGGSATTAALNHPRGIAVDATGVIYIADLDNRRIRRVSPTGMISTFAGNGTAGFGGDGGPATLASLSDVSTVALDAAGNLFIGDASNRKIRRISLSGTITTIAGIGIEGFSGDGGPAVGAMLGRPHDIAVDAAGNIYIADSTNHRIRRISAGGTITTIAGNGVQGFSGDGGPATSANFRFPIGVAVDSLGNVYVADGDNNRIRRINPTGIIVTVAGDGVGRFSGDGGLAVNASLNIPSDVALDAAGNLYIADAGNNRVRRVDSFGIITTAAGTGTDGFGGDGGAPAQAMLNFPWGLGLNQSGGLYIADRANNRIRSLLTTTAAAGPPALRAIVNGASFSSTAPIAPGAILSIFGSDLAAATAQAESAPLPTILAGTSVTFNGEFAPLFYVSPGQINLQAPFGLSSGSTSVLVRRGSQVSGSLAVSVAPVSPGIFIIDANTGAGAFLHASSGQIVSAATPARPSQHLSVFATGLGPLRTSVASGAEAPRVPPLAETVTLPAVTIGGVPTTVTFAGLAPGFVGLYQLNIQLPSNLPLGNQNVQIHAGGRSSNVAMMSIAQ